MSWLLLSLTQPPFIAQHSREMRSCLTPMSSKFGTRLPASSFAMETASFFALLIHNSSDSRDNGFPTRVMQKPRPAATSMLENSTARMSGRADRRNGPLSRLRKFMIRLVRLQARSEIALLRHLRHEHDAASYLHPSDNSSERN